MDVRRWAPRFGVAAIAVSVAAASWPSLSQRLPKFFILTLAVAGVAMMLASFVTVARRAVRAYRAHRPLPILWLVVSTVGVVVLVVLPLVRFVGRMRPPPPGSAPVLARFGTGPAAKAIRA